MPKTMIKKIPTKEAKRPDLYHSKVSLEHLDHTSLNRNGDILQLEKDTLRQKHDDRKESIISVCFANLKMYMEKLSR